MRLVLLPLLGVGLSVSSLFADSIVTTADLHGQVTDHCAGTDYCLAGNLQTGPYSEVGIDRTVQGNTITYVVSMNFNGADGSYGQGNVTGTIIDVPSNWDWVNVSTQYQESGDNAASSEFFLEANFDPTHTRIPQGNGTYALDPTVEEQIQVTGDAEEEFGTCGLNGCSYLPASWVQYTISLAGPSAPNDPAPTPEPTTAGLLSLALMGFFSARRRFSSANLS